MFNIVKLQILIYMIHPSWNFTIDRRINTKQQRQINTTYWLNIYLILPILIECIYTTNTYTLIKWICKKKLVLLLCMNIVVSIEFNRTYKLNVHFWTKLMLKSLLSKAKNFMHDQYKIIFIERMVRYFMYIF